MELPHHLTCLIAKKCDFRELGLLSKLCSVTLDIWNDPYIWKEKVEKFGLNHLKNPASWARAFQNFVRKQENKKDPSSLLCTHLPVSHNEKILSFITFEDGSVDCIIRTDQPHLQPMYQKVTFAASYGPDNSLWLRHYKGVINEDGYNIKDENKYFGSRQGAFMYRLKTEPIQFNQETQIIRGRWMIDVKTKHIDGKFHSSVYDWCTGKTFDVPFKEASNPTVVSACYTFRQLILHAKSKDNLSHFVCTDECGNIVYTENQLDVINYSVRFVDSRLSKIAWLYKDACGSYRIKDVKSGQPIFTNGLFDSYTWNHQYTNISMNFFEDDLVFTRGAVACMHSHETGTLNRVKLEHTEQHFETEHVNDWMVSHSTKLGTLKLSKPNALTKKFSIYYMNPSNPETHIITSEECILIKTDQNQYSLIEF